MVLIANVSFGQWLTDFKEAQKQAKEKSRNIMLSFSGSDWCMPCMQMKKDFFESSEFKNFADEKLVLINADFPRRNKKLLTPEQVTQNEALADKYNSHGEFPLTILLDPEGKVLKQWIGLPKCSVTAFIEEVKSAIPAKTVEESQLIFKKRILLMGSRFDFSLVSDDEAYAQKQLDLAVKEVSRIEALISSWDENSQTTMINNNAGIKPVKVDAELFDLIKRANKISVLTQGAFDLSFGSIDKSIWHFDGSMNKLPDSATAKQSVFLINYKNILLDEENQTVFLKNKGMRIGFGAIGKGYAAEQVKALWLKNGIKSGIVNAGGDLTVWGMQPNGEPWTIGIANPDSKNEALSSLSITDRAVVTSGNYEKFIEIDGKKYCHIINPRNGFPVSGLKSVTIIANNAELADAFATSVFILGSQIGLDLINQLDGIEAFLVDDDQNVLYSNNIILHANAQ